MTKNSFGVEVTFKHKPQMRLSNYLKNNFPLKKYRKSQLICMEVQVHNSSEPPMKYNQDQTLHRNQDRL